MKRNNQKTSERFKECFENAKIKQAALVNRINSIAIQSGKQSKELESDYIPSSHLSNYKNYDPTSPKRQRPIPDEHIPIIAQALKIHEGYLFGDDDYQCNNYSDYCERKKLFENPDFSKYDRILAPAGLLLSASAERDESIIYTFTASGNRKEFTEADMEFFYNAIIDTIRKMGNDYVSYEDYPLSGNKKEWDRYLKWHPDFFDDPSNKTYFYHLYEKAIKESKTDNKAAGRPQPSPKRNGGKKNEKAT